MNDKEQKDSIYTLSNKDKPLTEDDVRIIVSQQLRNIVAPTVVQAGYLQSGNFVSGTSGWQLSPTGAEFQSITIAGVQLTTKGSFGGDGSNGALAITAGTTTIDLANAQAVTKNYTSISITGTGKLAFSNPHANGTIISLKSQGAVTLTSSTAPMLDASGMGGTTGGVVFVGTGATAGTDAPAPQPGAAGGNPPSLRNDFNVANLSKFFTFFAAGASGGAGMTQNGGAGGTGGRGGGVLILECGGTLTFTTASGISVAGANGTAGGQSNNSGLGGSGGSGGGGGTFIGLYNTAGTITGTINVSGGSGGGGGARLTDTTNQNQTGGGGGGGGASVAGTTGITGTTVGGAGAANVAGVAGGAGFSIAIQNLEFS